MSEVLAGRDSDLVLRELAQTTASVIEAQRVLIVGAGSIPKLLGELNRSLAPLGFVCTPLEPAQGLYKTFADLLACPSLAPLLTSNLEPVPAVLHAPAVLPVPAPVPEIEAPQPAEPEPSLPVVDVSKLDMSKPINWKSGDIFISNPRVTLAHQCRKWVLDSFDVADLDSLTGMDVQLKSPNTTTTELLTLKLFMAQYVFFERPPTKQSAAE